ncbi:hypothetical protein ZIOFF_013668 [Zingiber officinale]|uniref:RING-type E3 ubiquitin transferase n=1 Tax=Zingiber officinale TaxID=94328 RepID=A0A8J5HG39_ZINOF|nr:hypothetical protein ZIOFF_013668 [Zingiber officinale]
MAASPLMAEAKPPSAPRSSSSSPPPILAVAILGILTTAILLLSYYLFVTKCRTGRRLRSPLANQARGLHPSLIRSIPVVNFTVASNDIELRSQCAVCLNEFQNMERLKLLPGCSHTFHIDCIETWLQFNANCTRYAAIALSHQKPSRASCRQLLILCQQKQQDSTASEAYCASIWYCLISET